MAINLPKNHVVFVLLLRRIMTQIANSSMLRIVAKAIAIVHVIFHILFLCPYAWLRTDFDRDCFVYYVAAKHVSQGHTVYTHVPNDGPSITPHTYLYPPQLAIVLSPLANIPYITFARGWFVICEICFWAFAALLGAITTKRFAVMPTILWGLVLACTPGVYADLVGENIDPIIWMLAALAIYTGKRSAIFAILTQIKPYFGFCLPYLALRERNLVGLVTPLIIGFTLVFVFSGPQELLRWRQDAGGTIMQGTWHHYNISLSFTVIRLLHALNEIPRYGPLPVWAIRFLIIVNAVGDLLAFLWVRRLQTDEICIVLPLAAMLLSPLCWEGYLPIGYILVALYTRKFIPSSYSEHITQPIASLQCDNNESVLQVDRH
jgi:hypothetical protein